MALLFVLLVLFGFIAMLVSRIPNMRLPEWPAWAFWTVAALLWAVPQLG